MITPDQLETPEDGLSLKTRFAKFLEEHAPDETDDEDVRLARLREMADA